MTVRPILFSAPMVRALLEGRKTQTRRLVSARSCTVLGSPVSAKSPAWTGLKFDHPACVPLTQSTIMLAVVGKAAPTDVHLNVPWIHPEDEARGMRWEDDPCMYRVRPRVEAGDLLWVREAHYLTDDGDYEFAVPLADEEAVRAHLAMCEREAHRIAARHSKVRQSIHMPRWASRITLEVTAVKVELLQDITCADAIAEGIPPGANSQTIDCDTPDPRHGFRDLWDSLHKPPHSWADNPWIIAISFRVHQRNVDQMEQAA